MAILEGQLAKNISFLSGVYYPAGLNPFNRHWKPKAY